MLKSALQARGVLQTAAADDPQYFERRQAIRETWLPALASMRSTAHAFIVGTPAEQRTLQALQTEEDEHGGKFLVLDTEVRPCMPPMHTTLQSARPRA